MTLIRENEQATMTVTMQNRESGQFLEGREAVCDFLYKKDKYMNKK